MWLRLTKVGFLLKLLRSGIVKSMNKEDCKGIGRKWLAHPLLIGEISEASMLRRSKPLHAWKTHVAVISV